MKIQRLPPTERDQKLLLYQMKKNTFPRTCNLDPAVIIILTWLISSNLIELLALGDVYTWISDILFSEHSFRLSPALAELMAECRQDMTVPSSAKLWGSHPAI